MPVGGGNKTVTPGLFLGTEISILNGDLHFTYFSPVKRASHQPTQFLVKYHFKQRVSIYTRTTQTW